MIPGIDDITGVTIQAGGEKCNRRDTHNLSSDIAGRESTRGLGEVKGKIQREFENV